MVKRPSNFVRRGWCQGVGACDASGGEARVRDKAVARWSIDGAIDAAELPGGGANGVDQYFRYLMTANGLQDRIGSVMVDDLIEWNDAPSRTQAEVVALLERVEAEMTDVDWEPIGGAK